MNIRFSFETNTSTFFNSVAHNREYLVNALSNLNFGIKSRARLRDGFDLGRYYPSKVFKKLLVLSAKFACNAT